MWHWKLENANVKKFRRAVKYLYFLLIKRWIVVIYYVKCSLAQGQKNGTSSKKIELLTMVY